MEVLLSLFHHGEDNRSGDNCHLKDSLLLIVPKRRRHATPNRASWKSTRVEQKAEGMRGNASKSFYYGFHEMEWTRQGKQTKQV